MSEFVRLLVGSSERAANIARIIRAEDDLFSLLVEEKCVGDKNERFVQDFKTLGDVLIQESLRHAISKHYPEMADSIYGEENSSFTNSLGEGIEVKIGETEDLTRAMLSRVLGSNSKAAELLAKELHQEISIADGEASSSLPDDFIESYAGFGIWIDPIDATNEYIKGRSIDSEGDTDEERIWSQGLRCVTVLIGVFELDTGTPIMGFINQPFWKYDASCNKWQGRHFWGLETRDHSVSSLTMYPRPAPLNSKKTVIMSESEDPTIRSRLEPHFNIVYAAGAGYKLLAVATGMADLYFLSKNSTHYWDTCGPHAILKSLGGGIMNFQALQWSQNGANGSADHSSSIQTELTYQENKPGARESHFANTGGILAFREVSVAFALLDLLIPKT